MAKKFNCSYCGHLCHCLGKKNTVNELNCDLCSCMQCGHEKKPLVLRKKYKYQTLDKFVRIVITSVIVCICLLIGLANTP